MSCILCGCYLRAVFTKVPPPSQLQQSVISTSLGRDFSFSFVHEHEKFIPSLSFLSPPFSFFFFLSLSHILGGDCGGRWRNKDTRPGYALADEQRRNAFIHRRRWWWMRGAHQREPIRSCSRTTNGERRGVEGPGGWESGINKARATSTNHSPSDLETLGALSSLPLSLSSILLGGTQTRETYPATTSGRTYGNTTTFEHRLSWRATRASSTRGRSGTKRRGTRVLESVVTRGTAERKVVPSTRWRSWVSVAFLFRFSLSSFVSPYIYLSRSFLLPQCGAGTWSFGNF